MTPTPSPSPRRSCVVCALPAELLALTEGVSGGAAARALAAAGRPIHRTTILDHRARCDGSAPAVPVKPKADGPVNSFAVSEDGTATVTTKPTDAPRDAALADVFARFGHDPAAWTVKSVAYSQLESAEGVVLTWYKAAFTPASEAAQVVSDEDLAGIRKRVWGKAPAVVKEDGDCSFLVCLADLQLGKSEGGGVAATVDRFRASVAASVARFKTLKRQGRRFERVVLAQMGDPVEGCSGNYASQTFTVELNQRAQLLLALDLLAWAIRQFQGLGVPVRFVTVHSNHGEWSRGPGGRTITSESDTADGFLGDALERIFAGVAGVEFVTPHEEAVVPVTLSGVPVAFTHGHKAPGAAGLEKWVDDQSRVLIYEHGFTPRLWVAAHMHHLRAVDLGAYTLLQCPASDGGSSWFKNLKGRWATSGVLTCTVGAGLRMGWDDLAVC